MAGITIKIQKGVSIFAGMAAVADAEAKGRTRYENDKLMVTYVDNTYRVYKKRGLRRVRNWIRELSPADKKSGHGWCRELDR